MALILFKWLFVVFMNVGFVPVHPIYMSVTEIDHNAKDKTLEISCKVYTDDFEKTLRTNLKVQPKIDLLNPKYKNEMKEIVSDYIKKHLIIYVDGQRKEMSFLGFERQEEGIVSFFQINNVSSVRKLTVTDNILYEYKQEQMSLLHVTVNGNRKSTKLINPDEKAEFSF